MEDNKKIIMLLEEIAHQLNLIFGQLKMGNQNSYFKYKSEYLKDFYKEKG